jgi:ABC-2 type transport system permease protein
MLRNAFLKGLRDLRRSFVYWAIGAAVLPIWLALMFPSMEKSAADVQAYVDAMPEAFAKMFLGEGVSFASPVGFIDAELFSFMGPIVLMVFAITLAVRQIAGEEENGTLALLLAYPVTRGRLLLQKAAVVAVAVLGLTVVVFVALVAGVTAAGVDLGVREMLEAHVSLYLLTLAVAMVSFAVGAATGSRAAAAGAGTVLAAGSYLLNALAPLASATEPLQKVSLFYYYGGTQPLYKGLEAGNAAVLLAVAAASLAAAYAGFARRDVHV